MTPSLPHPPVRPSASSAPLSAEEVQEVGSYLLGRDCNDEAEEIIGRPAIYPHTHLQTRTYSHAQNPPRVTGYVGLFLPDQQIRPRHGDDPNPCFRDPSRAESFRSSGMARQLWRLHIACRLQRTRKAPAVLLISSAGYNETLGRGGGVGSSRDIVSYILK